MQPNINIVAAVDVIKALSERSLKDSIFMMDNSLWKGPGQGTASLSTLCCPGQLIQWVVYAIDVQTPASIRNITFIGADDLGGPQAAAAGSTAPDPRPDLNSWTGFVPCGMVPGLAYRYRLEIQMGTGKSSILSIDTASLKRTGPAEYEQGERPKGAPPAPKPGMTNSNEREAS